MLETSCSTTDNVNNGFGYRQCGGGGGYAGPSQHSLCSHLGHHTRGAVKLGHAVLSLNIKMCSNKRPYLTSYTSLIVINSVSGLVSKIQAIYHM